MQSENASARARLGGGPYIFSGVPPLLTGQLELSNVSDEKLKLRSLSVAPEAPAMRARGFEEVQVGVRLAPNERARAQAHFVIDQYTPPGTYRATIDVGDQRQPIVAHVFEKLDLRIEPSRMQLRGAGGDVVRQPLVISNRGNVTETLRELALVFLEERHWVNRSLVFALRETAADEGHQAYLDRVVKELRGSLIRPARVVLHGDVKALEPGQTAEVELEMTLPRELVKGRTYIGSTPFMSGTLSFEVECNGSTNSTQRRPR
jgi:hypothetical protein